MGGSSSAASVPVAARQRAIDVQEIVEIPVDEIRVGTSMRERGVDPAHVATLAEVPASWPPILVQRSDRSIVDGQHRVLAAKQLGLRHILAVWFDGSPEDGYLEFVRRNVAHGLPLTLVERRRAARRILCSRPDFSDRGIGALCGLSPRTVARLREEAGTDAARTNGARHSKGRVGRDGRVRPIDPAAVRADRGGDRPPTGCLAPQDRERGRRLARDGAQRQERDALGDLVVTTRRARNR